MHVRLQLLLFFFAPYCLKFNSCLIESSKQSLYIAVATHISFVLDFLLFLFFFFLVCMRLFSLADRRIYSKILTTSNTRR